jgi:hypothetical protein
MIKDKVMKANEMPERIYLFDYNDAMVTPIEGDTVYVREDAFIEKACDFLRYYRQDTLDGTGYVAGVVNDKTIEAFKCYMKGE